ncbi:MAG: hypothetical protein WD696_07820 [Bryobacteraceae bacterium]
MEAPIIDRAGIVKPVERELDAHLRSLRRKLERAVLRGEPLDRLQARIRSEEDLLGRMRAYRQGLGKESVP